jgi:hypothetical protein
MTILTIEKKMATILGPIHLPEADYQEALCCVAGVRGEESCRSSL